MINVKDHVSKRGRQVEDIYFSEKYGRLYEKVEKGKLTVFEHKTDHGSVRSMFIKRQIPLKINSTTYYDLITPYGYGGPMVKSYSNDANKEGLVMDYYQAFKAYCQENRIVSEFIRFHPIFENHKDFAKIYEVKFNRKTIGTNLQTEDGPFLYDFKKECRRKIRKSLGQGVSFEIIERPENLDVFKELYYQTMTRNAALDYYYFNHAYFETIIDDFKNEFILVNVFFDGKTIASKLCFISGKLIHCHLSGILSDYFGYSPGYILEYATALWGRENQYDYIHHGGGRSNDPADKLLQFKKNFGRHTEFSFYRGEKIWNPEIYKILCGLKGSCQGNDFFPNYRIDPRKEDRQALIERRKSEECDD